MTFQSSEPNPMEFAYMTPLEVELLPDAPTEYWPVCDACNNPLAGPGATSETAAVSRALNSGWRISKPPLGPDTKFATLEEMACGGELICCACWGKEFA